MSRVSRKLKAMAVICLLTSFAGVIFQLVNDDTLDYNSVLFGFPLGIMFCLLELFLFPRAEARFRSWSFSLLLACKAVLYTAIIFFVLVSLTAIIGLSEGRTLSELFAFLGSIQLWILVLYTLVVYSLLVFLLQVNRLLGDGVLLKFIRGKYHRPREEERIFMFLDMASSTTVAEQLGHVRFYALLNELFHEISQPVLQTKAEVYQYVGDEVILTWELRDGLENSNCVTAFLMFRDILVRKTSYYSKSFGVQPQFKAGLHCGKVVTAQIGDIKREIIYNGDVLNTTARIRDECNKYGRDCLVSEALMTRLGNIGGIQWEKIDKVALRGKEAEMLLFGIKSVIA